MKTKKCKMHDRNKFFYIEEGMYSLHEIKKLIKQFKESKIVENELLNLLGDCHNVN